MPDGVNIGEAFDFVNSRIFWSNPADNRFDRRFYISYRRGGAMLSFPFGSQGDNRRAADALDLPVRQTLVGIVGYALQIGRN